MKKNSYKTLIKYKSNLNTLRELMPDKNIEEIDNKDIEWLDDQLQKNTCKALLLVFMFTYRSI